MKKLPTLILLLFIVNTKKSFSEGNNFMVVNSVDSVLINNSHIDEKTKHHLGYKVKLFFKENKKAVAAVLAFPLPFGFFGGHRIYLGTKPYIPFVYVGTLGGCVLILPFIDFVAILLSNDESFKDFENNPKVFMWAK